MNDTPDSTDPIEQKDAAANVAVSRVVSGLAWQGMDSAPRDGTEVLLKVALRAGIPGPLSSGALYVRRRLH